MPPKPKVKDREGLPTFDVTADDSEHPGETKVFTFARRPMIQGDAILSYFSDSQNPRQVAGAIRGLVAACLHPDDTDAYRELVTSERYFVGAHEIARVAADLSEAYSARPSQPSLNS